MDQRTPYTPFPFEQSLRKLLEAQEQDADQRLPPPEPPAQEELLTRKQTAKLLGITLPTLRKYTCDGLIPGYRIGTRVRYKRSEVIGALQAMQVRKVHKPK